MLSIRIEEVVWQTAVGRQVCPKPGINKFMGQYDQIDRGSDLAGLLDAALEIAARRRETTHRLRTALVNSDTAEVLKYARELCGLENEEASNTAGPGLN